MPTHDLGIPVSPQEPQEARDVRPGVGLCLSGGGYRAMLFHLGALWRLNEWGYLPRLTRVSSVSGGSITAGALAKAWPDLGFDAATGVSPRFEDEVVGPVRKLAGKTLDIGSVAKGIFWKGNASDHVTDAYRKHLFGDLKLRDLPTDEEGPRFIFNAANLQSGVLVRFSQPYIWDYKVGVYREPEIDVAVAVAASSAFPPFLSPTILRVPPGTFQPSKGATLNTEPYTTTMQLTDGGVYDNLGLETVWKNYDTVLVSDGGGKLGAEDAVDRDYVRHTLRVLNVIDNQVRSLRKRQLMESYDLPTDNPNHRKGAFWDIRANPDLDNVDGKLPYNADHAKVLAKTATRLAKLDDTRQERLINWGYAACDVKMRRWLDETLPPPTGFPYPAAGLG
jgi:NTE family protein